MKPLLVPLTQFSPTLAPLELFGRGPRVLEPHSIPSPDEANEYDRVARNNRGRFSESFVELVSRTGLERGRVLDIGSGPGLIPVALASRHPGWEIWGLDPCEEMLALARRHAEQADVANRVHFDRGNATALPYAAGTFDLVISHFTLHHIERPEALFDEAARVVRGGGKVIIKDLARPAGWKAMFLRCVIKYLGGASSLEQRMFRESLGAALSVAEVEEALKNSKLSMAQVHGFWGIDFVIRS